MRRASSDRSMSLATESRTATIAGQLPRRLTSVSTVWGYYCQSGRRGMIAVVSGANGLESFAPRSES
jgi:hypothetical protein